MGALIALSLRARVSRVRSGLPFMLPNAIGSREFYWCSFGDRSLNSNQGAEDKNSQNDNEDNHSFSQGNKSNALQVYYLDTHDNLKNFEI